MKDKAARARAGESPAAPGSPRLPAAPKGADAPVNAKLAREPGRKPFRGGGTVLDVFATASEGAGERIGEAALSADDSAVHDAWVLGAAASRGGTLQGLERAEASFLEVIVGEDDRIPVEDPSAYPFRCICSLRMRTRTGHWGSGTGWLVGPRTVITAGHCVYMHDYGGWIQQMEVYPARHGQFKPFTARAERAMTVAGWKEDALPESDYGAVRLDGDVPNFGTMGYAALEADWLESLECQISGYPSDKGGTQWGHARRLLQVLEKQLEYDIDTIDGNSGGPVFVVDQGNAIAIGIHNYGSAVRMRNTATRITRDVFDNIKRWSAGK